MVRSMSDDTKPVALGNSVSKLADPQHPDVAGVLSAFPAEVRTKLKLTEQQVQLIMDVTASSAASLNATIPMLCRNSECEYKELCLFHKMKIAPDGERCPDEVLFIDKLAPALIKSMNIDTDNYIEWDMLREYVDAMVQERRAERLIALGSELAERISTVNPQTGIPYTELVVHPANTLIEASTKRKARIRKDMLLTREMREKFKKDAELDDAQRMSAVRSRMEDAKAAEDADFEDVPDEHKE